MKGLNSTVYGLSLTAFCLAATVSVAEAFRGESRPRAALPVPVARQGMTVLLDLAPVAMVAVQFRTPASVARTRPGEAA